MLRKIETTDQLSDLIQSLTLKKTRLVALKSFCLMPNHFHLQVEELEKSGCAKYMHKISSSYTKYFNIKYYLVGHLFQGKYKSKLIENTNYYSSVLNYIHNNPTELNLTPKEVVNFEWSSYTDYVNGNRWSTFLDCSSSKFNFEHNT